MRNLCSSELKWHWLEWKHKRGKAPRKKERKTEEGGMEGKKVKTVC
jgi:hypothetical protein